MGLHTFPVPLNGLENSRSHAFRLLTSDRLIEVEVEEYILTSLYILFDYSHDVCHDYLFKREKTEKKIPITCVNKPSRPPQTHTDVSLNLSTNFILINLLFSGLI